MSYHETVVEGEKLLRMDAAASINVMRCLLHELHTCVVNGYSGDPQLAHSALYCSWAIGLVKHKWDDATRGALLAYMAELAALSVAKQEAQLCQCDTVCDCETYIVEPHIFTRLLPAQLE